MHGFGSHTFKLVNSDGNPVYCKFHFKTDQVYIYINILNIPMRVLIIQYYTMKKFLFNRILF